MKPDRKIYALVFGKVVSTLRSDMNLTQSQLAGRVGVDQPTISRLERGTLIPDAMLTEALAKAFGLSVGQLLDYVNEGVERTKVAAEGALGAEHPSPKGAPWWSTPLKVAGIAGLAGLAIFAVAAALAEEEEDSEEAEPEEAPPHRRR